MLEILLDHIALSTFEAMAVIASTFPNIGLSFDFAGPNGELRGISYFDEARDGGFDMSRAHRDRARARDLYATFRRS